MLIGYKLEYVRDHTFWNGIEDDMADEQMAINNKLASFWSCQDIAAQLDSIIEEIDKETP